MFSILGKKYDAVVLFDLGDNISETKRYYDLGVMAIIRLIDDEMGTPKRIFIEETNSNEK